MDKLKKVRRTFSTEFKKEKVSLIEQGKVRISEICRLYSVSEVAVYKWIQKYGLRYEKTERIVIEKKSEEKKTLELMQKVAELERIIGKQQLQLIYKESVIEQASELLGEDIEKKFDSQQ